eukprot:10572459-Ditylum_brightwellii.AAC.1
MEMVTLNTSSNTNPLSPCTQGEPTDATTSTELFALHKGILKVSDTCNFSSSIGYSIGDPSTVYEDNA